MEKEITEREAIQMIDAEMYPQYKALRQKYNGVEKFWWEEGFISGNKAIRDESFRRYFKLKETFAGHETLPESEVMKIIKGDF